MTPPCSRERVSRYPIWLWHSLFLLLLQCLEPPYKIATNDSSNERCYRADASPDIVVLEIEDTVDNHCENDSHYDYDSPNFTPIHHITSVIFTPPQVVSPSVPLTDGVVVVFTLVAVCLLLKGYTPVCPTAVGEQPYQPFKNIQKIEANIPQFLHLFGVRSLVIQGLTPYGWLPLVEERPEQVDAQKLSWRKMFGIYNLHSGVKLLLFVQFTPSGLPTSLDFLLLELPLGYLAPHSTLYTHTVLL